MKDFAHLIYKQYNSNLVIVHPMTNTMMVKDTVTRATTPPPVMKMILTSSFGGCEIGSPVTEGQYMNIHSNRET